MAFQLPDLPYDYGDLEKSIDAQTMELHHTKHHNTYVTKLNDAIKDSEWDDKSIDEIMANVSKLPMAVRNNGGGHYNHALFWQLMSPNGGGKPTGALADDIASTFGSFDTFAEQFSNAALTRFGSGWAWLVVDESGKLQVTSTPNQDNPVMDIAEVKGSPILGRMSGSTPTICATRIVARTT